MFVFGRPSPLSSSCRRFAAPFVVKRWKAREAAAAVPAPVDPAVLSQYEQQIEEDLKDLD